MSTRERERGEEVFEGDLSHCWGAESQRMFGSASPDRCRCGAGRGGCSGVEAHAGGASQRAYAGDRIGGKRKILGGQSKMSLCLNRAIMYNAEGFNAFAVIVQQAKKKPLVTELLLERCYRWG